MKAEVKSEYNDKTTLWAVVLPIVVCAFTSFIFWMSPLGLGFNPQAVDKLNSGFTHEIFQLIFWAGPISIFTSLILILLAVLKPEFKLGVRRVIFIFVCAIIISQISMLIFLSA